jgi:tetratricopeptide (TPR) repeat protein
MAFAAPGAGDPRPASADTDNRARAQVHLANGAAFFNQGDFRRALEQFEAAYEAFPSAKLYFNMGQAHRRLEEPAAALVSFERFLRDATLAPESSRAEARRLVEALQPQVAMLTVRCAHVGAEVLVEDPSGPRSIGTTPLSEPVPVDPGRRTMKVKAPGLPLFVKALSFEAGKAAVVDVTWPVEEAVASTRVADVSRVANLSVSEERNSGSAPLYTRWWFWLATAALVVGAGMAAVQGLPERARDPMCDPTWQCSL